jgi:hypothetical protein
LRASATIFFAASSDMEEVLATCADADSDSNSAIESWIVFFMLALKS